MIIRMFKGEFEFNLKDALSFEHRMKPQYGIGYHATNEPIEKWMQLTPVARPRVLTVAASGDQPLMYAAYGASHIDTFDLTVNACAVMDYKTTALQLVDYDEYIKSVNRLKYLGAARHNETTLDIIDNMPERTYALMSNIAKYRPDVFQRDTASNTAEFPRNAETYARMRAAVTKPFNFIWADLDNVPNYISGQYDIINTSNIFEHYLWYGRNKEDIFNTITKLWPYLSAGGYILCTRTDSDLLSIFRLNNKMWQKMRARATFPTDVRNRYFRPIIIQKIR